MDVVIQFPTLQITLAHSKSFTRSRYNGSDGIVNLPSLLLVGRQIACTPNSASACGKCRCIVAGQSHSWKSGLRSRSQEVDGTTRGNPGPLSCLDVSNGRILVASRKLPGPEKQSTACQTVASIIKSKVSYEHLGGPKHTAMQVNEQQRNCVRLRALLVNEVQFERIEAFQRHGRFEVRKLVQRRSS